MTYRHPPECTLRRFTVLILFIVLTGLHAAAAHCAWPGYLTDKEKQWLDAHPVITIAPDPSFAPVEFFDENGIYRGLAADYVSLIEKTLGFKFVVVQCKTWEEALQKVRLRHVDALPASAQSPERSGYLLFTEHHIEMPSVIITRKQAENDLALEDLQGMRVSMVQSYAWREVMATDYPDIEIDLVPDVTTGLKKVSFGMSDAMVVSLPVAIYYIEKEGITNLRVAGETGYMTRLSFAVRADWPELHDIMNKTLAALPARDVKVITRNWMELEHSHSLIRKEVVTGLIAGIIVIAVMVLGVALWNLSLRRKVDGRTDELKKELAERYRAEEALRRSEQKFRDLVETLPDVVYATDDRGNITYVSPVVETISDYRVSDILGRNFLEFIHKEDVFAVTRRFSDVMMGKTVPAEYQMVMKSGESFWVRTFATPIFEGGRFAGVRGVLTDMTARHHAEEAIRRSEEKYRTILENIQEGYFETDLRGKLTFFNYALPELSGYTAEELMQMELREYMTPESTQRLMEKFGHVYETGEPSGIIDYEVIAKDGHIVHAELSASLMCNGVGKPVGFRAVARDVTDRKRAEKEIEQRRRFLEALFEGAPNAVVTLDEKNRVAEWNPGAQRLFGYTRDEALGQSLDPLITDSETYEEAAGLTKTVQTGAVVPPTEAVRYRKDGSPVNVILSGAAIVVDEKLVGSVAFYTDITGLKIAEETLRRSEEKYRNILENMDDCYFEVDLTGNLTFANRAVSRLAGVPADDVIGISNMMYTSKETAKKMYRVFTEVYRTGQTAEISDYEIIRPDGARKILEFSASLARNAAGVPVGFRGLARDVTERKKSEEALKESEERYRHLVEQAPAGIYEFDFVNGRFITFNDVILEYTGYEREEMAAMNLADLMTEESLKAYGERMEKLMRGEPVDDSVEYGIRKKDGTVIWVLLNARYIYEEGTLRSAHVVAHDITERKHMEEKIKQSLREKEILLQEIHHRIKNNLQIVSSMLSLQSQQLTDLKALELFKDSETRIKSMALIHEKLYLSTDLSHIDFSGYVESLTNRLFQIYNISISQIVPVLEIEPASFSIETAIPCGLIVNELVSNALKYGFPDGRKGTVTVALHVDREAGAYVLTVADTGIGLPAHIHLETVETLGLQLVHDLTHQIDGTVTIERAGGTKFQIHFSEMIYEPRLQS
ncbi:MAG: PAS domain S-box protein [Deltaproteobacteria bacterium]|nr:PAS domain S-box protein [Deltaproteobacteria bacterium]